MLHVDEDVCLALESDEGQKNIEGQITQLIPDWTNLF